jgi:chromate transporter
MILFLSLINKLKNSGIVSGMTHGIQPVIGVMMAVMAIEFFKKSWNSWKSKTIILTIISLIALVMLNVNPGLLIGIALAYAFIESTYLFKKKKKQDTDRGNSL